jgi:hypothetical protein
MTQPKQEPGAGGEQETASITFIINGENVPVEVPPREQLQAAVSKALAESRNTGRPANQWDVRDSLGSYLDPARRVEDYGFASGVRLFLSLRVGAGGYGEFSAAR